MKLIIKKKDVLYGVNGSDAAITDMANIETLKEGSFLMAFDNNVVILADGTFVGEAGKYTTVYTKINGAIMAGTPIAVGKSSISPLLPDHAKASKVMTISIAAPASITESQHTGLVFYDPSKLSTDPTKRDNVEVYTDEDTVQADLDALEAKVAALDYVASVDLTTNTLTVTLMPDANHFIIGSGEFEGRTVATTTPVSYGDAATYAQMIEFAKTMSSHDGNRDTSIDGVVGTFTKDYGIENYNYIVFGLSLNDSTYATGKTDMTEWGAKYYIAIPEGDLAATGEGFMDIFKAATTGVSNDSGGAGADEGDN